MKKDLIFLIFIILGTFILFANLYQKTAVKYETIKKCDLTQFDIDMQQAVKDCNGKLDKFWTDSFTGQPRFNCK